MTPKTFYETTVPHKPNLSTTIHTAPKKSKIILITMISKWKNSKNGHKDLNWKILINFKNVWIMSEGDYDFEYK